MKSMCVLMADDHTLVRAGFARSSKSCWKYKWLPRSLSLARLPAAELLQELLRRNKERWCRAPALFVPHPRPTIKKKPIPDSTARVGLYPRPCH